MLQYLTCPANMAFQSMGSFMRQGNGQFAPVDPVEYLRSKVDTTDFDKCWNWTGTLFPKGYGYFKCKAVGKMSASRASWLMFRGAIPKGMFVCHKCDNRKCCNPDHLFLGTQKHNMEDCVDKGRINRGEDRPQSKLTEQQVIEIRKLRAEGFSFRKIASKFNVGTSTVLHLIQGETWKHVQ